MESNITENFSEGTKNIINFITEKAQKLKLQDSILYYNYPFFRDDEGELIQSEILIISRYGIFIIWVVEEVKINYDSILEINETIEQLKIVIESKLMINRTLREFKKNISDYIIITHIYIPLLEDDVIFDYTLFRNEYSLVE